MNRDERESSLLFTFWQPGLLAGNFGLVRSCTFVVACLLAYSPAAVSEPPNNLTEDISEAINQLDSRKPDDNWYFTMTMQQDDELLIIDSNPKRQKYKKRQLLSVNGESPSPKREKEFREAEIKRIDEIDPETSNYGYLVDTNTLEELSNDGNTSRFSFSPRIKALPAAGEKMSGILQFNNDSRQVETIQIDNTTKMSPAFSVTLEHYHLSFFFESPAGKNLLTRMESKASGKAGFLKQFDSKIIIDFSNYRPLTGDHTVSQAR